MSSNVYKRQQDTLPVMMWLDTEAATESVTLFFIFEALIRCIYLYSLLFISHETKALWMQIADKYLKFKVGRMAVVRSAIFHGRQPSKEWRSPFTDRLIFHPIVHSRQEKCFQCRRHIGKQARASARLFYLWWAIRCWNAHTHTCMYNQLNPLT